MILATVKKILQVPEEPAHEITTKTAGDGRSQLNRDFCLGSSLAPESNGYYLGSVFSAHRRCQIKTFLVQRHTKHSQSLLNECVNKNVSERGVGKEKKKNVKV